MTGNNYAQLLREAADWLDANPEAELLSACFVGEVLSLHCENLSRHMQTTIRNREHSTLYPFEKVTLISDGIEAVELLKENAQ